MWIILERVEPVEHRLYTKFNKQQAIQKEIQQEAIFKLTKKVENQIKETKFFFTWSEWIAHKCVKC